MEDRFHIDTEDPTPIYAQLDRAIRFAIATERLRIGEQLPTVRQLAVDLKINANTVAKVYAELERVGILETRRGVGTFGRARQDGMLKRARRSRRRDASLKSPRARAPRRLSPRCWRLSSNLRPTAARSEAVRRCAIAPWRWRNGSPDRAARRSAWGLQCRCETGLPSFTFRPVSFVVLYYDNSTSRVPEFSTCASLADAQDDVMIRRGPTT